ncbi:MAG: M23 family metallopeptidase [Myxococcota bacterium]
MRWTWLVLLLACDGVPAAPELQSRIAVTESTRALALEPVDLAEPSVEPSAERAAEPVELDELPEVKGWLPNEERCGHQGRRAYCNGPRQVPEPYGEAARRARELGLGTHRAAAELIRTRPRPEWLDALPELGIEAPHYPLHWPVDGGRFGRGLQFRGRRITHRGVDITAEVGTPVRAVEDALVGYADNTIAGYGNLLVLLHGGGEVSAYAHLTTIHAFPGQVIRRGQTIATAGNTGVSRGPHLHFEWREGGEVKSPMERFPDVNVPRWMLAQRR